MISTIDWEAAVYDRAVALRTDPNPDALAIERCFIELRRDLGLRRAFAAALPLESRANQAELRRRFARNVITVLMTAVVIAATAVFASIQATWIVGGIALIAAVSWEVRRETDSRAGVDSRKPCPRCDYSLSAHADALPVELTTWPIGPVQCPECGERWPLLPAGVGRPELAADGLAESGRNWLRRRFNRKLEPGRDSTDAEERD